MHSFVTNSPSKYATRAQVENTEHHKWQNVTLPVADGSEVNDPHGHLVDDEQPSQAFENDVRETLSHLG